MLQVGELFRCHLWSIVHLSSSNCRRGALFFYTAIGGCICDEVSKILSGCKEVHGLCRTINPLLQDGKLFHCHLWSKIWNVPSFEINIMYISFRETTLQIVSHNFIQSSNILTEVWVYWSGKSKFTYSEKATKFCEISTFFWLVLTSVS